MRIFSLLALALLLAGCVATETTGFMDPDYRRQSYQISSVVVRAEGGTLEETLLAEQSFAEKLSDHSVEVTKFTDIAPPTREYSPKQITQIVEHSGAETILTIHISGKSTVETYVPPVYHPATTTSEIKQTEDTTRITTSSTPGYITEGRSISEPVLETFSTLIDVRNGKQIWRAEGMSSGMEHSSYAELLANAAESAVEDLGTKGMLPK